MMLSEKHSNGKIPLFSVIVPAYNSAAFVEKCIESVLVQTDTDFELLLVDDGSDDCTMDIFNEYARNDSRVFALHQENQGHTGARNYGLENSRGEYVLFLDSDDWIDRDVLECCHGYIDLYKPDVFIFGMCSHIENKYNRFMSGIPDGVYDLKGKDKFITENLLSKEDGTRIFSNSLSGKIFKRSKVYSHQMRIPQEVLLGEDGACFVSTMMDSEIIIIDSGTSYHYTIREDSVSKTGDKYSLRRYTKLLKFYQTILNLDDVKMKKQFDRFVVGQSYTGLQFVLKSECDKKWLKKEFNDYMSNDFIREAIKNARFDKTGRKMQVKRLILRHSLFGLCKLLLKN